ncbi:hypothetical protein SLE2022_285210 [Rubroshorea leprosula]
MQGGQLESPWQISSHPIGSLVSNIYGKDDVLLLIAKTLLSNQRTTPLAIVRIAGVGKIALSHVLYSNPTVKNHFNFKLWISVSRCLDLKRIGRVSKCSEWCNEWSVNLQHNDL